MKRFIFLIIVLTFSSSLFALDNDYLSFRITPRFEILNGSINEFVFNEACKNTDNKESQLDWDIKNIPFFSLRGEVDIIKYIHFDLDGRIAVPKISGHMQDYDWLNSFAGKNGIPYSWHDDDPTALTNYSIHDNYLLKYLTFSVSGGANIKIPANITITPKIAYYYEFISMDGKDGYKTYKSNNWVPEDFSGKVISYIQEINAFLLGFSVTVETLPQAYFYADLFISPFTTLLNALDYHYLNTSIGGITYGTLFWDNCSKIFQLQSHIETQYKFNKYHSAGLSASLFYIPMSKGDTRTKDIDTEGNILSSTWTAPSKNTGGTSRLIWSLGINYSFSL